jgi:hypothetical protein
MKWRWLSLFIIISSINSFSCSDNMESCDLGFVYGDVFIKAIFVGDSIKYAPVFYAYSTYEMLHVSAYAEDKPTNIFQLDTIEGQFTFAYFPSTNEYKDSIPSLGDYLFNITFANGQSSQVTDDLSEDIIAPPVIDKIVFNESTNNLTVSWEKDSKVNNYKIMLVDSNNKTIFESSLLTTGQYSITIGQNDSGWLTSNRPEDADSLQIILQAYLFEPAASTLDIQCLATNNQTTIIWNTQSENIN